MVGILTLEFSLKAIYLLVVIKICNALLKFVMLCSNMVLLQIQIEFSDLITESEVLWILNGIVL
jgi:hypothetical protein